MGEAAETITEILIPYSTEYMMMIIVAASLLVGGIGIIAWKMQSEGKLAPFFGGMFMYVVFTMCLKSMCDLMIGPLFTASAWVQGIYEGLFWTALQTLGIYFGFTAVHKDHSDRRMSVTYGLGFGWMQILTSALLSAAMYYAFAICVNDIGIAEMTANYTEAEMISFNEKLAYLQSLTLFDCILSLLEVFVRVGLLTSISVIMFAAIKGEDTRKNIAVAVCLQFISLVPMGWHQTGAGLPLWLAETMLILGMACAAMYAKRLYDALPVPRRYSRRTKFL